MIRRSKYFKEDGPTSKLTGDCMYDGCDRPVFRKGMCGAHLKRLQRKKPVDGLINGGEPYLDVMTPEEKVVDAGSKLLETSAENDQLYKYRRKGFLKACEAWVESMGWRRPLRAKKA